MRTGIGPTTRGTGIVTSTEEMISFLGRFASNLVALADLRARHLDSNGDGTGDPISGQSYYNTTHDVMRVYDGTIWVGRPMDGEEADHATIYVRSTGSDAGGNGTLVDPYLTIEQALQDVPYNRDGQNGGWTIDILEAATFLIPNNIDFGSGSYVYIAGIGGTTFAGWTEVMAATAIDNPGGVIVDTQEDAAGAGATPGQHGRVVQITGAGWTPGDLVDCMVEVVTGNLADKHGWVIANTADTLSFRCDSDAYSDDGGAGLVDGDQIRLITPSTIVQAATIADELNIRGSVEFREVSVDADGIAGWGSATRIGAVRCLYGHKGSTRDIGVRDSARLWLPFCAIHGNLAIGNDSIATIRGNNQPAVIHGDSIDTFITATSGTLILRGRVCWVGQGGTIYVPVDLKIEAYDTSMDVHGSSYLALYDVEINVTGYVDHGRVGRWVLPPVIGNSSGATLITSADANVAYIKDFKVWLYGAAVYTTAGANVCRINGASGTYATPYGFEIIGTGNYNKLLKELKDWTPDLLAPYLEVKVGRNEAMEFAAAAILSGDAGFIVPPEYFPGTQLQLELMYVTEDPASGHYAVVDVDAGLFRPGTDDASAEPPDNLEQDLTNLVPVSSAAGVVEQSQLFDITDADGEIDSIALEEGQYIAVRVRRDGTNGSDDCAGSLYVLRVARVWNVGL